MSICPWKYQNDQNDLRGHHLTSSGSFVPYASRRRKGATAWTLMGSDLLFVCMDCVSAAWRWPSLPNLGSRELWFLVLEKGALSGSFHALIMPLGMDSIPPCPSISFYLFKTRLLCWWLLLWRTRDVLSERAKKAAIAVLLGPNTIYVVHDADLTLPWSLTVRIWCIYQVSCTESQ